METRSQKDIMVMEDQDLLVEDEHTDTIIPEREREYVDRRRIALAASMLSGIALTLAAISPETRRRIVTGFFEQGLLVGLSIGFLLVTLSLLFSSGQRWDAELFRSWNRLGLENHRLNRLMILVTQVGNGLFAFMSAALLYITGHRRLGLIVILGTLSLWLTVETIKFLTDRARPYLAFEEVQVVGWKARGRSFPSGHTSQTFFLTAVAVDYFQVGAILSLGLYILAVLVGFSRVYIGVHYPRDVIAGAILGNVWGILGSLISTYLFGGPV